MENSQIIRMMIAILSLGLSCSAQVGSTARAQESVHTRVLQQQYAPQLRTLNSEAAALHFPYPFYFSQILDIDEARQKQLPSGSIRFEIFEGQTVLVITGNYYASYSASLMGANLRARKTFEDVVMPVLKAVVPHVDRSLPFEAYAIEIAHHVRTKVIHVDTEGPENIMLLIPRAMAERLVRSEDVEAQQSVLLESEIFLNGEPFTLWLTGDEAPADVSEHYLARHKSDTATTSPLAPNQPAEPGSLVNPRLLPQSELGLQFQERAKIAPDLSPARMEKLQTKYEDVVQKLTAEISEQAHFVAYAPPAFIGFRDGAYLQLSMNTDLEVQAGSSQYRVAALAFDSHISHLLRPVSKYFHDNPQFEGVDFSTTVHQGMQPNPVSVEYIVPFPALACYEKYDCTGQELINRSVVLINGERVTLDLQRAEADISAGIR